MESQTPNLRKMDASKMSQTILKNEMLTIEDVSIGHTVKPKFEVEKRERGGEGKRRSKKWRKERKMKRWRRYKKGNTVIL